MSGIEVVGLVLGVLPLLISALEHYEDVTDPIRTFFKYGGELNRAIRGLRDQHASFEQSIQALLKPITTDEIMSDMIDNSNSVYWTDAYIDEALRDSLGKAYSAYMELVKEVENIMLEIATKLENLSKGSSAPNSLTAIL